MNSKDKNFKRILALERRQDEIREAQRKLGYEKLETPYLKGWDAHWVLRDDIARSENGERLSGLIEHFGRRGAIQEQLTSAIHQGVEKVCEGNLGVIVTIVATHNCVSCRGIKHEGASMITTKASGVFRDDNNQSRKEFFDSLKINNGGHQI